MTKYQMLRQEVLQLGFAERMTGRVMLELIIQLSIALAGIAAIIMFGNIWAKALGMILYIYGTLGVCTNTHTSSHYATSKNRKFNRALTFFGYPFYMGFSATYWWYKHCVVHHPSPNVVGVDEDIDFAPWFVLTEDDLKGARGWKRLYYRIQWLFIPFAIGFNGLNMKLSGLQFIASRILNPRKRKKEHWIDFGLILAHFTLWLALPMLIFPVWAVLTFYGLRVYLMGYALFAAFAPGHIPEEAMFVQKAERKGDYLLEQTATTVNFRTGLLGRFALSGLQYQIEHHLFPAISHVHYPKISKIVERFCREHGYPYHSFGWAHALWKSFIVFYAPKKIHPPLAAAGNKS